MSGFTWTATCDQCGEDLPVTSPHYSALVLALHECPTDSDGEPRSRHEVLRDEVPGPAPFKPWSAAS